MEGIFTVETNQIFHFIGIKGSGMSALALILFDEGYTVQGSDVADYFFTQKGLEDNSVSVYPFDADNITENMTIILGNAYPDDHPEAVRAKELGNTIYRYPEFIDKLMEKYTSLAIAGAHGKTSTTGLIAHVMKNVAATSYLIGDGTGVGNKDAEYFILEADEYRGHFLDYYPDYAIITNIDFDHPDFFKDLDHMMEVFQSFVNNVQKGIIACGDDSDVRRLTAEVPIYYYGFGEDNDIRALNIEKAADHSAFDVVIKGENVGRYAIPTFGDHNILNALSAIAFFLLENISKEEIVKHLMTYPGVKRRFKEKKVNGQLIVDDYAHHPSEITATLDAARQRYPDQQIIAVFQPHTFSRLEALMDEFAESLEKADIVYVAPIFTSVREKDGNVTSEDLAKKVGREAKVLDENDMSALMQYRDGVIIFMGAGDIQKYQNKFEDLLSNN